MNRGGAGNVKVTVSVGSRSEAVTRVCNPGEEAWVTVLVGNLLEHPDQDIRATVDYKATQ